MLAKEITTTKKNASTIAFTALPTDVILHIFSFLDIKEQINLLVLNKLLHDILSTNPSYWRSVLESYTQQFYPQQGLSIFKQFTANQPFDALAVVESLRILHNLNALAKVRRDKVSALEQEQAAMRSRKSQPRYVQQQVVGMAPFGGYVTNPVVVSYSASSSFSPYFFCKFHLIKAKKKGQQKKLQALEANFNEIKGSLLASVPSTVSRAP
jgi:hypothetical protein